MGLLQKTGHGWLEIGFRREKGRGDEEGKDEYEMNTDSVQDYVLDWKVTIFSHSIFQSIYDV